MILIIGSTSPKTAEFATQNNLGTSTLFEGIISDSKIYHTSLADCPNLREYLGLFDKIYWANSEQTEFFDLKDYIQTLHTLNQHGNVINFDFNDYKQFGLEFDLFLLNHSPIKESDVIKFDNDIIRVDLTQYWVTGNLNIYEDGFISPDNKFFVKKIPKNASTFLTENLLNLDWKFAKYPDCKDLIEKTIVILRDPIHRWISGIVEYLFTFHYDVINDLVDLNNHSHSLLMQEKLGLSIIFKEIVIDDHTERQCCFLNNVNIDKTIWFKFDDNLNKNLHFFFQSLGLNNNFLTAEKKNNRTENDDISKRKKNLVKIFESILTDNKFKKKVEEQLWCDIELFNKVKFYNITQ